MNKVILMGRLTADPEVREAEEGRTAITRYSLAVDRRKSEETDFINVVTFGKSAEFARSYLYKGQRILIEGHIQTGSYINKDNQKIYTVNVVADNQEFADGKPAQ